MEKALVALGRLLRAADYKFVTVTPETHRRVNARAGGAPARSLRDVFGWSRPFSEPVLGRETAAALFASGMFVRGPDGLFSSRVRFSTLGDGLYVHSAYPTVETDAVFFGPDTYRYCAALAREIRSGVRLVDVGCGSGAGALSIAGRAERLVLADINDQALSFARVNATLAGVTDRVEIVNSDILAAVRGSIDVAIANPPYVIDPLLRAYRDGGDGLGTALGLRIVREALSRLSKGGKLVLYSGSPIVDGEDMFLHGAAPILAHAGARWRYEALDPDVFGEELETPAYAGVERIAAVLLCAEIP